jgi:hypothetical protein
VTAALEADSNKGPDAIGGKDGGDHNFVYEAGTNKKLTPSSVQARAEPDSLKQGLVLWLTFDEGTGTTTKDLSGNGNNGTLVNGPTWTTGKIGGALSFDGVDDWVRPPAFSFLGQSDSSFTVIAWVKPNIIGGTVIHNRNDSTGWSTGLLGFKNGKAAFYIYNNPFIISPNTPNTNSWIFLAGVRNGTNSTHVLYENGNLVAQGSGVYSSSGGSHTPGIGRFVADCCQMAPRVGLMVSSMKFAFTTAPSLIQKSKLSTKPPNKIKILNPNF